MKKTIGKSLMLLAWCSFTLGTLTSTMMRPSSTPSAIADDSTGQTLQVRDDDLNVRYGEYQETEIDFTGIQQGDAVKWEIVNSLLPAGFEIEDTTDSKALVFG